MTAPAHGWRPIESAPFGVILVKAEHWECRAYRGGDGRFYDAEAGAPFYVKPTHWQPLPLPPPPGSGDE